LTGKLAPPPEIADLRLPEGSLAPIAIGPKSVVFLAMDEIKRSGSTAEIILYQVFDPAVPTRGMSAVQYVKRERIDCQNWTNQELGGQSFTEDGRLAIWMSAEPLRPIAKPSSIDLVADVVCGQAPGPSPQDLVRGHAAALKLGRQIAAKIRAGNAAVP
jgi:hypothetical protein